MTLKPEARSLLNTKPINYKLTDYYLLLKRSGTSYIVIKSKPKLD